MDGYITKPVKREELRETLERWVPAERKDPLTHATYKGPASDAIDSGTLEKLREIGGEEMVSEVAELFIRDAGARLDALRKAVEDGDAQAAKRLVHSLKGSSANIGAKGMAEICAKLESAAASEDLKSATELREELATEFEGVRSALAAETGDRPVGAEGSPR